MKTLLFLLLGSLAVGGCDEPREVGGSAIVWGGSVGGLCDAGDMIVLRVEDADGVILADLERPCDSDSSDHPDHEALLAAGVAANFWVPLGDARSPVTVSFVAPGRGQEAAACGLCADEPLLCDLTARSRGEQTSASCGQPKGPCFAFGPTL